MLQCVILLSLLAWPFCSATFIFPQNDPKSSSKLNHLFVFGNSYTSVSFNPNAALPSPKNPIGNPQFPGATLAGGKNWIGFLTADYNVSVTLTYDFAFSCATVDTRIVPTCGPGVRTFVDQVGEFEGLVAAGRMGWDGDGERALFAVWFGINDVDRSCEWRDVDHAELFARVLEEYFRQMEKLYEAGGRKFLLLGVPAIERAPRVLEKPKDEQLLEKRLYGDFNVQLYNRVGVFRRKHKDAEVVLLDTAPIFNYVLDHPEQFGAIDAFCFGGYDDGCLWADNFHPGRILNDYLARNVVRALIGRIDGFFRPSWE